MTKKILFAVWTLVLFGTSRLAFASVLINEVMYDLDGGDIDWVEVYNPDGDVDLTTLKLLISNSSSNHSITKSSGSSVLHAGDYGVIVASSQLSQYTSKWGTAGNIFTSSFSLPNTGGKVEINDGDKLSPMTTLTYSASHGASGNGKSLQKISGTWQESLPTPGTVNVLSLGDGDNQHTQAGETQNPPAESEDDSPSTPPPSSGSAPTVPKPIEPITIKTKIITKSIAFTNLSTSFIGSVIGDEGKALFYGRYVWNFGDGDSEEMKVREGNKISHTYFYPGEYDVTLEYYVTDYGDVPESSDTVTIKVLSTDVLISEVGTEKDFFVTISNNTETAADISRWLLSSNNKSFAFPKNTIIPSKKKITFSPFVTGLTFLDKSSLKLANKDGKIVFDYGLSVAPVVVAPISALSLSAPVVQSQPKKKIRKTTARKSKASPQVALASVTTLGTGEYNFQKPESLDLDMAADNLEGAAIGSGVGSQAGWYKYLFPFLLGGVTLVGGASVYLLRKSKIPQNPPEEGEDFDILDE